MKRFGNILSVTLVAAALMRLGYVHLELKHDCETLAWQEKCLTDQFKATFAINSLRARRNAQKTDELEASLQALTAEKGRIN